jgi:hypothetical protein
MVVVLLPFASGTIAPGIVSICRDGGALTTFLVRVAEQIENKTKGGPIRWGAGCTPIAGLREIVGFHNSFLIDLGLIFFPKDMVWSPESLK